jgi:hypothetical protein
MRNDWLQMTRKIVNDFAMKMISEYPVLKHDIIDFVTLAIDEIDEGASPTHEWELAYRSIEELISEHKNKHNDESID